MYETTNPSRENDDGEGPIEDDVKYDKPPSPAFDPQVSNSTQHARGQGILKALFWALLPTVLAHSEGSWEGDLLDFAPNFSKFRRLWLVLSLFQFLENSLPEGLI